MSKNAHDNTTETHRKIGEKNLAKCDMKNIAKYFSSVFGIRLTRKTIDVSTKEGVLKILSANVET